MKVSKCDKKPLGYFLVQPLLGFKAKTFIV